MIDTLYLIGFTIVQTIADLTGLDYTTAWWICIFLFSYVFIVSICLRIDISHHKRFHEKEKNLTFDIDWVWYSYARVLHSHPGAIQHIHHQHQTHIGLLPYLQQDIRSYIPLVHQLKHDIKQLESYMQTNIVPDSVWKKIDAIYESMPATNSPVASLVKILTFNIYRA